MTFRLWPVVLPPAAPSAIRLRPPADPSCGFAITWGIDNHLKTPYAYSLDLSIQRELPGGFMLEANYVGRLGHHLLRATRSCRTGEPW